MAMLSASGLLPQPSDFRKLCAEADTLEELRGNVLHGLAMHSLDINGLHRLAKSVTLAINQGLESPLTRLTLGLVSNANTDFIIPALVATAARYGIALKVISAPFGVTMQAALDPDASLTKAKPDAILLALDYREFIPEFSILEDPEMSLESAVQHVSVMANAFQERCQANIIVQTIVAPPERLFGSMDRRHAGAPAWFAARFNERLSNEVCGGSVLLLDAEYLANRVGVDAWFDRAQWITARLPFSQNMVPLYADSVARLLGSMRGKSRRVLVLDLDNTLWGGVVGDDGVEGIVLGQGDPRGEAYLDMQKAVLALKQRGILLAICSKNNADMALAAFRHHPAMLLKENDFAAMRIDWNDKASNIEAIAAELSLGLDSFVFVDDNPIEREQVRQALPQVAVLELSSNPATYSRTLLGRGYFESITFSEEDRKRADFYASQSARNALLANSRDLTGFLASLEMRISFNDMLGWERFTQLINKSNQFNLTTRRYSQAEIMAIVGESRNLALQVRLADRFDDNGMISAIICRPIHDGWEIDTWVMSCRVLNRMVEFAVINEIVRQARSRGIRLVYGIFLATERNNMVRDHYAKLGFELVEDSGQMSRWVLDSDVFTPFEIPIKMDSVTGNE